MTTLTCRIPKKLDARLAKRARLDRISKQQFVRRALEQAASPVAEGSAFDLVKEFCGSLSGSVDLASNPKHLEGFGA